MKKITVLAALAALIFTGCNKDDGPDHILKTLTFEDIPAASLAGPTAYGENLYSAFGGEQFTGYSDAASGLAWEINEAAGSREFHYGGLAVSQWNDRTTEGYLNQCSVYGTGGHNGSKTFGVATGMKNDYGGDIASLHFGGNTERVVDHLWLCNTTYDVLSMRNGDSFGAKKFSYEDKDWLRLTLTGYTAAGASTGTVEVYLADFRAAGAPGIVEGWHRADLSPLGAVNRLTFTFDSSDVDDYGMKTPAYVCVDDIAVRQ